SDASAVVSAGEGLTRLGRLARASSSISLGRDAQATQKTRTEVFREAIGLPALIAGRRVLHLPGRCDHLVDAGPAGGRNELALHDPVGHRGRDDARPAGDGRSHSPHDASLSGRRPPRAFSLIELMVVIGIIAILIAL